MRLVGDDPGEGHPPPVRRPILQDLPTRPDRVDPEENPDLTGFYTDRNQLRIPQTG